MLPIIKFFLSSCSYITFSCTFWNSYRFSNYFVTKRSLNNTPCSKFSLNCKQHSKARKKLDLRKELSLSWCPENSPTENSLSSNSPAESFPSSNSPAVNSPEENFPEEYSPVENSLVSFSQIIFVEKMFLLLKIWFFIYEGD